MTEQIGFNGADRIAVYYHGQQIAEIGPFDELKGREVSIQYFSRPLAREKLIEEEEREQKDYEEKRKKRAYKRMKAHKRN